MELSGLITGLRSQFNSTLLPTLPRQDFRDLTRIEAFVTYGYAFEVNITLPCNAVWRILSEVSRIESIYEEKPVIRGQIISIFLLCIFDDLHEQKFHLLR